MENTNYLDKLNKEQFAAATCTEGPVLVLAGAGSGKTRVLTSRIAYIIEKELASPREILAITFTNKAADEMRERVVDLVGDCASDMWISTIHSMCLRILRASIGRLDGYQMNFSVYSEVDKERVIKRIITELDFDEENLLKEIKNDISYAKTRNISPDQCVLFARGNHVDHRIAVFKRYEEALKSSNAMDFDDLLNNAYYLLANDKEVLSHYANKFKYILIDEFQDTNHTQYEIVKLLSSVHGNIFAVGDDDQSIYGWRGAEIKNILGFEKDFNKCKIFKLQQNYRSTKKILEFANAVISRNETRKKKTLWTENDVGASIRYYSAESEIDEVRYVVTQINGLIKQGAKCSDFAILMRVNALSRLLENELLNYNLPYKIFGGLKFFERKEIKDLTAYLRVIANPLDDDAVLRIINTPKRGIGDRTKQELVDYANNNDLSIYEAIGSCQNLSLKETTVTNLQSFKKLLYDFILESDGSIIDLVNKIIDKTNFLSQFEGDNEENESKRLNIHEFVKSIQEFCNENKQATLSDYLSSIALYSDLDEADSTNYVTVATVHSAKGLEFNTVFIIGLDDDIFPIARANNDREEFAEERRLMYVAITRAKERLFVTRSKKRVIYGQKQDDTKMSIFLRENAALLKIKVDGYQNQRQTSSSESGRKNWSDDDYGYSADIDTSTSNFSGGMSNYAKTFARSTLASTISTQKTGKDFSQFTAGKKVVHEKFGIGTIITVQQYGKNCAIDVVFKEIGIKHFTLAFAPIELLD